MPTGKLEDSWIEFLKPNEFPSQRFINYDRQINALTAIALTVYEGGSKAVLLFGFPGIGKSLVPYVLGDRLKSKFKRDFSLFMIHCNLAGLTRSRELSLQLLNDLDQMKKDIARNIPAMVCFDEIDCLASQPHTPIFSWLRRFLDNPPQKTLLLGTTNYPGRMEACIYRVVAIPIYFEPPSLEFVEEVFRQELKVRRYKEIARLYWRQLLKLSLYPQSYNIMKACQSIKTKLRDIENTPDEIIIETLLAHSGIHPSAEHIVEYEEKNKGLVELSSQHILPFWNQQFDLMQKGS